MSLRWRIALILAAVAAAVSTFAALSAYLSTDTQLRAGIDQTLRSRASAVNSDVGGPTNRGGRDGNREGDSECPSAASFQPASAAQLVATDGTVTACIGGGVRLTASDHERTLAAGATEIRTVTVDGHQYRQLTTSWHDGGILQIARSLTESSTLLHDLRLRLITLAVFATLITAMIGWWIATRITRPIITLRDTTQRIADTLDLSAPVNVKQGGEVGSLAASFTTMIAAVARSQEQQRRLVSDASHEMRTPLTSLRSNVELLDKIERLPIAERGEVVADVLQDIDELSALLAELVELASDAAGTDDLYEPAVLGEIAESVASRVRRRTHRPVNVVVESSAEILGNTRQLERAISNLVDNAVKYSPDGTPIDIVVAEGNVTVLDRGRGIAEADRERIFDRFYRAVDVRSHPGSGLGLSIVAEIVRRHGGVVFARSRDGGWCHDRVYPDCATTIWHERLT